MKKKIQSLIFSTLIIMFSASHAQIQTLYVSHYNVENLFDTIDDPNIRDEEYLPGSEKAWNSIKYQEKLNRLTEVIAQLNQKNGPDLLGLCEVENQAVVADLAQKMLFKNRKYAWVHYDSPDQRGIDVALVYDTKKFKVLSSQSLAVKMPADSNWATRDVLLVSGKLKNKARLHVLVNHWPSRSGGQEASEPKRVLAATVVRRAVDSLRLADPKAYVIVMGDLNDGPNDIAPRQVLGADSLRSDSLPLFSPFLPYHADITQGSYNYRGSWQYIDHLLFSTNVFAEKSKLRYVEGSARAERFEFLLEQEGRFAGTPWRSFAGNRYLGGYSDHLPVSAQFELHK